MVQDYFTIPWLRTPTSEGKWLGEGDLAQTVRKLAAELTAHIDPSVYPSGTVCGVRNDDFILKNHDFLLKNLDFLLKNVDFIIKIGRCWRVRAANSGRGGGRRDGRGRGNDRGYLQPGEG